jgi:hypothetical protein
MKRRPYIKKKMNWWDNHPGQSHHKNAVNSKVPIQFPDNPASILEIAAINLLDAGRCYRRVMGMIKNGTATRTRVNFGPMGGAPFYYKKVS